MVFELILIAVKLVQALVNLFKAFIYCIQTTRNLFGWLVLWCLTFNDISVISWRSVLLVAETGVPVENH